MATRTVTRPDSFWPRVHRFAREVSDAPAGHARIRLGVRGHDAWDADIDDSSIVLRPASERQHADAEITADARAWHSVARDLAGGLDAHRAGRLVVRRDMHLGVGFLAATSGLTGEGRLRFARVRTRYRRMATLEAGTGRPLVALHGLGGTKISFLPTLAAVGPGRRGVAGR